MGRGFEVEIWSVSSRQYLSRILAREFVLGFLFLLDWKAYRPCISKDSFHWATRRSPKQVHHCHFSMDQIGDISHWNWHRRWIETRRNFERRLDHVFRNTYSIGPQDAPSNKSMTLTFRRIRLVQYDAFIGDDGISLQSMSLSSADRGEKNFASDIL
jgi:hypothetical protein